MTQNTAEVTSSVGEDHAMQLVFDLTEILMEKQGFDEPNASMTAQAIVEGLREKMGASWFYVPAQSKSARNAAIRAFFNGTNYAEVCLKFGISLATAYRITGQR